ncbi:MAG: PIN domain-containing protein [Chloroflexi bacterium]|nr:PIN domain-containing protein [Chloroflexota bacterium]
MLLTLDSSVIVAALRDQEAFHPQCRRVLELVSHGHHLAVEPYTVLIEVTAAIRRRTGSPELAERVYQDLRLMGSLQFVELDSNRADGAVGIAREAAVRGMDAIVVSVAREFGSALVSLDDEMVNRVAGLVQTRSVTDF